MSGRKKDDLKLIPLDDLKKVVRGLVAVPKHQSEKHKAKPKRKART